MRRGAVYAHPTLDRRFVVLSADRLTESGTAIVAEIYPEPPAGMRGLLAVTLPPDAPVAGAVLAWRINYISVDRLGKHLGELSPATMELVDMALRTAMDL